MKNIETTLSLLKDGNKILLAMKKRGFGVGKYNGVGGKLEENETKEEAMLRETKEEINVTPTEYQYVGIVKFDEYYKGVMQHLTFHLYIVTKWEGTILETEEMAPYWFDIAKIPYDKMFPVDKYWLPLILAGKKIDAYFKFDKDWNLIEQEIKELKNN